MPSQFVRCTLGVALLSACFVTTAGADALFGADRSLWSASSETSRRSWRIENTATGEIYEVRQFSSSMLSRVSPHEDLDFVLGFVGGASQDRTGETAEIDGLGDVKAKAFFHTLDRRMLLSAGLNLPTGVTALDENQVRALRAVQPTVLGFRQREYGRGMGIDLGAAMGFDVKPGVTVGGGIGALIHGEYDVDASTPFQPGNELTFTAGADVRRPGWTTSADVVYRMFGTDRLDGTDAFQEGSQIELSLRSGVRNGKVGFDIALSEIIKSDNEVLLAGSTSSGGDNRVENGNTFWLAFSPRVQPNPWFTFKGLFDLISANQSQQQGTSAWGAGIGLGVELQLTDLARLELRGQRLTGGSEDSDLELSGWDAAVAILWQE